MFATIALLAALAGAPQQVHDPAVGAAIPEAVLLEHGEEGHGEGGFDILHHIQDSQEIETPFGTIHLPERGSWMVGPIDMTPSKHVVFLGLTAIIVVALLLRAAASSQRLGPTGAPRRGHGAMEALVLFLRDQVVMPNVGHGGERYVPFVVTLFFFIL